MTRPDPAGADSPRIASSRACPAPAGSASTGSARARAAWADVAKTAANGTGPTQRSDPGGPNDVGGPSGVGEPDRLPGPDDVGGRDGLDRPSTTGYGVARPSTTGYGVVERPQACLLEIVSKLAREPWTDRPSCVHPTLASIGRVVHDFSSPAGRRALLPLAPAFLATARTGFETSSRLVALCVSTALTSPAQDRITAAEQARLAAAHQTALHLLSGRTAHQPAGPARWWLPVLDRVRLSEGFYRTSISTEHAAEAVSVTARASGADRDIRLRRLLKQCLATAAPTHTT